MKRFVIIATALFVIVLPSFGDAGADGAAMYNSKCALCHGKDGSGNTPSGKSMKVRDLRRRDVQKLTDKELFAVIAEGKGSMPAFKAALSQSDIEGLVAFIRTLKKKK